MAKRSCPKEKNDLQYTNIKNLIKQQVNNHNWFYPNISFNH